MFWGYPAKHVIIYGILGYKQSLTCYLDFLKVSLDIDRPKVSFRNFSRENMNLFITSMRDEKNLAIKTCNLRITAIKSFLKYCSEEDITLVAIYNDVNKVRCLKEEKKPILYLSREAIRPY
jgi:integrase/recombinase XerD